MALYSDGEGKWVIQAPRAPNRDTIERIERIFKEEVIILCPENCSNCELHFYKEPYCEGIEQLLKQNNLNQEKQKK